MVAGLLACALWAAAFRFLGAGGYLLWCVLCAASNVSVILVLIAFRRARPSDDALGPGEACASRCTPSPCSGRPRGTRQCRCRDGGADRSLRAGHGEPVERAAGDVAIPSSGPVVKNSG